MPLYPRTGNYGLASLLNQALAQPADYRPGLDFGIHAEMTDFPAWEPLSCKLLHGCSLGSRSFKNPIPKQALGNERQESYF